MTAVRTTMIALAVAMGAWTPLAAQDTGEIVEPAPVRAFAEGSVLYAQPVGEFADHIDRGVGLALGLSVPIRERSPWSIRLNGGVLNYGNERREVTLGGSVGGRIRLDLTTTNNVFYLGVGPQVAVTTGTLRPYALAFAGGAYFNTTSSLSGTGDHEEFGRTVNHDDLAFSWGGGAGVRLPLPVSTVPVLVDFGARYHRIGEVEYLREGDITDRPDGTIQLDPQRSRADMLTIHVGVSVGLRSSIFQSNDDER